MEVIHKPLTIIDKLEIYKRSILLQGKDIGFIDDAILLIKTQEMTIIHLQNELTDYICGRKNKY